MKLGQGSFSYTFRGHWGGIAAQGTLREVSTEEQERPGYPFLVWRKFQTLGLWRRWMRERRKEMIRDAVGIKFFSGQTVVVREW